MSGEEAEDCEKGKEVHSATGERRACRGPGRGVGVGPGDKDRSSFEDLSVQIRARLHI